MSQVESILDVLYRLQTEGGDGNFAIFTVNEEKNYYLQVSAQAGATQLYCEAVGDAYLKPENKLNPEQYLGLIRYGWVRTAGNYTFIEEVHSPETRQSLADFIHKTLTTVYGLNPQAELDVELILE